VVFRQTLALSALVSPLVVSDIDREILESIAELRTIAHREVQCATVLLDVATGKVNTMITRAHNLIPVTVRTRWEDYVADGLAGFGKVRPDWRRKRSIDDAVIVEKTTNTTPPGHTTGRCSRWALRSEYRKTPSNTSGRYWESILTSKTRSRSLPTRTSARSSSTSSVSI